MSYVRVTEPHAVRHPDTGDYVVPNPTQPYRSDDPLVKAYPWLFEADANRSVEDASAAPGAKRSVRRDPR